MNQLSCVVISLLVVVFAQIAFAGDGEVIKTLRAFDYVLSEELERKQKRVKKIEEIIEGELAKELPCKLARFVNEQEESHYIIKKTNGFYTLTQDQGDIKPKESLYNAEGIYLNFSSSQGKLYIVNPKTAKIKKPKKKGREKSCINM